MLGCRETRRRRRDDAEWNARHPEKYSRDDEDYSRYVKHARGDRNRGAKRPKKQAPRNSGGAGAGGAGGARDDTEDDTVDEYGVKNIVLNHKRSAEAREATAEERAAYAQELIDANVFYMLTDEEIRVDPFEQTHFKEWMQLRKAAFVAMHTRWYKQSKYWDATRDEEPNFHEVLVARYLEMPGTLTPAQCKRAQTWHAEDIEREEFNARRAEAERERAARREEIARRQAEASAQLDVLRRRLEAVHLPPSLAPTTLAQAEALWAEYESNAGEVLQRWGAQQREEEERLQAFALHNHQVERWRVQEAQRQQTQYWDQYAVRRAVVDGEERWGVNEGRYKTLQVERQWYQYMLVQWWWDNMPPSMLRHTDKSVREMMQQFQTQPAYAKLMRDNRVREWDALHGIRRAEGALSYSQAAASVVVAPELAPADASAHTYAKALVSGGAGVGACASEWLGVGEPRRLVRRPARQPPARQQQARQPPARTNDELRGVAEMRLAECEGELALWEKDILEWAEGHLAREYIATAKHGIHWLAFFQPKTHVLHPHIPRRRLCMTLESMRARYTSDAAYMHEMVQDYAYDLFDQQRTKERAEREARERLVQAWLATRADIPKWMPAEHGDDCDLLYDVFHSPIEAVRTSFVEELNKLLVKYERNEEQKRREETRAEERRRAGAARAVEQEQKRAVVQAFLERVPLDWIRDMDMTKPNGVDVAYRAVNLWNTNEQAQARMDIELRAWLFKCEFVRSAFSKFDQKTRFEEYNMYRKSVQTGVEVQLLHMARLLGVALPPMDDPIPGYKHLEYEPAKAYSSELTQLYAVWVALPEAQRELLKLHFSVYPLEVLPGVERTAWTNVVRVQVERMRDVRADVEAYKKRYGLKLTWEHGLVAFTKDEWLVYPEEFRARLLSASTPTEPPLAQCRRYLIERYEEALAAAHARLFAEARTYVVKAETLRAFVDAMYTFFGCAYHLHFKWKGETSAAALFRKAQAAPPYWQVWKDMHESNCKPLALFMAEARYADSRQKYRDLEMLNRLQALSDDEGIYHVNTGWHKYVPFARTSEILKAAAALAVVAESDAATTSESDNDAVSEFDDDEDAVPDDEDTVPAVPAPAPAVESESEPDAESASDAEPDAESASDTESAPRRSGFDYQTADATLADLTKQAKAEMTYRNELTDLLAARKERLDLLRQTGISAEDEQELLADIAEKEARIRDVEKRQRALKQRMAELQKAYAAAEQTDRRAAERLATRRKKAAKAKQTAARKKAVAKKKPENNSDNDTAPRAWTTRFDYEEANLRLRDVQTQMRAEQQKLRILTQRITQLRTELNETRDSSDTDRRAHVKVMLESAMADLHKIKEHMSVLGKRLKGIQDEIDAARRRDAIDVEQAKRSAEARRRKEAADAAAKAAKAAEAAAALKARRGAGVKAVIPEGFVRVVIPEMDLPAGWVVVRPAPTAAVVQPTQTAQEDAELWGGGGDNDADLREFIAANRERLGPQPTDPAALSIWSADVRRQYEASVQAETDSMLGTLSAARVLELQFMGLVGGGAREHMPTPGATRTDGKGKLERWNAARKRWTEVVPRDGEERVFADGRRHQWNNHTKKWTPLSVCLGVLPRAAQRTKRASAAVRHTVFTKHAASHTNRMRTLYSTFKLRKPRYAFTAREVRLATAGTRNLMHARQARPLPRWTVELERDDGMHLARLREYHTYWKLTLQLSFGFFFAPTDVAVLHPHGVLAALRFLQNHFRSAEKGVRVAFPFGGAGSELFTTATALPQAVALCAVLSKDNEATRDIFLSNALWYADATRGRRVPDMYAFEGTFAAYLDAQRENARLDDVLFLSPPWQARGADREYTPTELASEVLQPHIFAPMRQRCMRSEVLVLATRYDSSAVPEMGFPSEYVLAQSFKIYSSGATLYLHVWCDMTAPRKLPPYEVEVVKWSPDFMRTQPEMVEQASVTDAPPCMVDPTFDNRNPYVT